MTKFFATLGMAAAMAVVPAFGQIKPTVRANVPFDFVVGSAVMPAGQYDIKNVWDSSETLIVKNTEQKASAFVIANPVSSPFGQEDTVLVFRTIGDTHYLQQVRSITGTKEIRRSGPAKGGSLSLIKAAVN